MPPNEAISPRLAARDASDVSDRLESWKEIASYLKRGVTTVQRWEREEGLPVHRHQHDALGSVYALKPEIERWRVERTTAADTADGASLYTRVISSRRHLRMSSVLFSLAMLLLGAIGGALALRAARPTTTRPIRRLAIVPPNPARIVINGLDRALAIAPDGTRVAYVGGAGAPRLFVRPLDKLDASPIPDVMSPRYPFFSPDGQWIGFFEGFTALKKVPAAGGPVTELTFVNAGGDFGPRGATWGPDNQIAFAVGDRLLRVSADGGTPQVLAVADHEKGEAACWWPEYLPGGGALLFTIVPSGDWSENGFRESIENAQIAVLDLRSGTRKILVRGGSHAQYLESGHLVYASAGMLKAVAFDLQHLAVSGVPKTVLEEVAMSRGGAGQFDVAHDGTLVYARGEMENDLVTLIWVDRQGREQAVGTPPFSYRYPRLSPDGQRVVLGSPRDLGIWDLSSRKLTWFGVGPVTYPMWTPDGRRLIFASTRAGAANIYRQAINGDRPVERLTDSPYNQFPTAVSPDGRYLVIREDGMSSDLMLLDLERKQQSEPLIRTPFMERNAGFSPDGKLLAYESNDSGQDEVYVEPFPNIAGKSSKVKISTGGGTRPQWAPSGHELFYFAPSGELMSLPIQRQGSAFTVGAAIRLFDASAYFVTAVSGRTFDVSPDGSRFLMMKPAIPQGTTASTGRIDIVLNWFDELARLDPRH